MYREVNQFVKDHQDEIQKHWKDRMQKEADIRYVKVISEEVFDRTSREFIHLIFADLMGDNTEFASKLEYFSEKIIRLGWPLSMVTLGIQHFVRIVAKKVMDQPNISKEEHENYENFFDEWMSPIQTEIIDSYTKTWEKTVSLQKIALQELSAPLIPVIDQISVMPLVGTIDTERARLIMDNLLSGVVKHRSEVVLIDITGVPLVDTMVAHHIIQAADAVRLVGATAMLVGIRPEIAQTMVNLGIHLNQYTTKSTMQKGMEAALELTKRKIVHVEDE
ncbi:RsbR protein [Bacillus coahuilensis m2-6]|uniref:STAS domain-containing protein n=1 Tax=Bacillus coahuilensis TaxID=408580 RepID=UPI00018506BA|nr:STAS domain-containing protein [Bacillus coahuilensis]KUP04451.1 RsbR protein [Bacillus coahuilensis m2-6]